MAIGKDILDPRKKVASYWRLARLDIDLMGSLPVVRYCLAGYASRQDRDDPEALPADYRHGHAVGDDAFALMYRPTGVVLRDMGIDVDSWSADARHVVDGRRLYDLVASLMYREAVRMPAFVGGAFV